MSVTPDTGEQISLTEAIEMTTAYRNAGLNDVKAVFMGRHLLEKLMEDPNTPGIRFYYGLNSSNELTLVMVGTDAEGKDITSVIGDRALPCPTCCDIQSPLYS